MKLLTLNLWGGRIHHPLIEFLNHHSSSVEIFCFQEVFNAPHPNIEPTTNAHHHILSDLKDTLSDFNCYYYPAQQGPGMDTLYYPDISYGLAIFCRKTIRVQQTGDTFIYSYKNAWQPQAHFSNIPRNMAFITIQINGHDLTIYNVHGLWNGQGKSDTPDRLQQSHNIVNFIQKHSTPHILCGDFNLTPDTQSMAILNQDHTNLITKHHITSTRTALYTKDIKLADYILLSPAIVDNSFAVLPDEVSDHAALLLDFDLVSSQR